MKGAFSVLMVLSLGAAITMYQSAGVGVALGLNEPSGYASDDALEEQARDVGPNDETGDGTGGLTGAASQQEGSIVGLIVNASGLVFSFVATVVLLPVDMIKLGFPVWFALPVGLLLQCMAGITSIQFAVNRVLQ